MATYNGAKYIKEQMDSILSQRFKENDNVELEIIVSDDGSTDDTISILESYHDSRIKIFHHKNYSKYKYFKVIDWHPLILRMPLPKLLATICFWQTRMMYGFPQK